MQKIIFLLLTMTALFNSCSNDSSDEIIDPKLETPIDDEKEIEEPVKICTITDKDSLLIVEAESFALKGSWRVVEDEKASGGKYIEYYGANNYTTPNLAHEISVKFSVKEATNFTIKWYMRQPSSAEGDKSNDTWIYFPGNVGRANVNGASVTLEHYEKFVSRGKVDFTYGGVLDLENPKASSWMWISLPAAGEYTLKICGRSEYFQLDKMVFYKKLTDVVAMENSKNKTEFIICN